ncbi:enolase C-terminal domain-like protein [Microbacterium sp. NPDC058342]|uniref:enolase C-terminal domain-like protein n=1 Tax=Microbacterium sp. NPDC058342 TaxID=3346454 RepID=UPI00365FA4A0
MSVPRIVGIHATPIALEDPPLLNAWGVHEPEALRIVVELLADDGSTGLGECQGGSIALQRLLHVAPLATGLRIDDAAGLERIVRNAFHGQGERAILTVLAPLETAALDAEGRYRGIPCTELLGGRRRDRVGFAGYLFYKWPGHPDASGILRDDEWGEAADAEGVVRQARELQRRYGFESWKLKGGVFPPAVEREALEGLAREFPQAPLRWDPNCAWTVPTARDTIRATADLLEYLEDPVGDLDGMAALRDEGMPLASNMLVATEREFEEADEKAAVDVLLVDHHYWGGMRRAVRAADRAHEHGWRVSMHSNSHVGISLAAMSHVAAAIAADPLAGDTHYPWTAGSDVVASGVALRDGGVELGDAPGLGVDLDRDALAAGHERYLRAGRTRRDDTGYMRRRHPDFRAELPRW